MGGKTHAVEAPGVGVDQEDAEHDDPAVAAVFAGGCGDGVGWDEVLLWVFDDTMLEVTILELLGFVLFFGGHASGRSELKIGDLCFRGDVVRR